MHLILQLISTVVSIRIMYLLSDLTWSTANVAVFEAVTFLHTDNPLVSQQIIGRKDSSPNTTIHPMASAGLIQTVLKNCIAMLEGAGSYNPNADELIVYWWLSSNNNGWITTYLSGVCIPTPMDVTPLFLYNDKGPVTDKSVAINQTPPVVQIRVLKDIPDQNIYDPSNAT
jgi:hypothetical protein